MRRVGVVVFSCLFLSACQVDSEKLAFTMAKEMCSCMFVVQQTEAYCRESIGPIFHFGSVEIDTVRKRATGRSSYGDGNTNATFRFVSEDAGCELLSSS